MQDAVNLPHLRQVIGKGRSQVGAEFDDLRFAERRVQRVGRIHEFDGGTQADSAALLAFGEPLASAWLRSGSTVPAQAVYIED